MDVRNASQPSVRPAFAERQLVAQLAGSNRRGTAEFQPERAYEPGTKPQILTTRRPDFDPTVYLTGTSHSLAVSRARRCSAVVRGNGRPGRGS